MAKIEDTIAAIAAGLARDLVRLLVSGSISDIASLAGRGQGARPGQPARHRSQGEGGHGARRAPRKRGRPKKEVPTAQRPRKQGKRRTSSEIEELADKAVERLVALAAGRNDGVAVGEIAQAMGVEVRELGRSMELVLKTRRAKRTGSKGAARYFPVGG
jgi:hypothetical protein